MKIEMYIYIPILNNQTGEFLDHKPHYLIMSDFQWQFSLSCKLTFLCLTLFCLTCSFKSDIDSAKPCQNNFGRFLLFEIKYTSRGWLVVTILVLRQDLPDYICINLSASALKFALEKGRLRRVTLKFHQF